MQYDSNIGRHDPNREKPARPTGNGIICQYCNAVYQEKHWQPLAELDPKIIDDLVKGCCTACHLEKGHNSDGIVHLSGTFLEKHKDDIRGIIDNTGETEEERDFMNRIERIDESDEGEISIYTTKNQLAVEIGKKIDNAYKGGELQINFSKDEKPVEVHWHKDI